MPKLVQTGGTLLLLYSRRQQQASGYKSKPRRSLYCGIIANEGSTLGCAAALQAELSIFPDIPTLHLAHDTRDLFLLPQEEEEGGEEENRY
jgi:hypothetical protein